MIGVTSAVTQGMFAARNILDPSQKNVAAQKYKSVEEESARQTQLRARIDQSEFEDVSDSPKTALSEDVTLNSADTESSNSFTPVTSTASSSTTAPYTAKP